MKNLFLAPFNGIKADFSFRNQLFYAVLVIIFTYYGFFYQHYLLLLFSCYYLFYLISQKKLTLLFICATCFFFLGARYVCISMPIQIKQTASFTTSLQIYPDTIKINGNQISADGRFQNKLIRMQYRLKSADEQNQWQKRQKKLTALSIKGHFIDIEHASNQHAFDYLNYLSEKDYLGIIEVERYQFKATSSILLFLHQLRAQAIDHVEKNFRKESKKYVLALLFGYRNDEFIQQQKIFSATGILHLFSISGTHVLFFFGLVEYFFKRIHLSFHQRILPMLMLIVIGIFLFGASISVWRAAILYVLRLFFSKKQFQLSSLDLYSLVCLILILLFPNSFVVLSGQLSLLVAFYLLFIPKQSNFKQSILHMTCLTILTAPFILAIFFEWPILGGIFTLLFTFLFQWFILPACLVLFILSFSPMVFSIFETCFIYLLTFVEKILAKLSFTSICIGQIPLWLAVICMLVGLIFYSHKKYLPMVFICLGFPFIFHLVESLPTKVTFVDVGQGDCAVIQSSFNQEVYIIDTGGKVGFQMPKWQERKKQANVNYTLLSYLKGEGIQKVDGLILTHGDKDHMGDALTVMRAIKVKNLYVGTKALKNKNLHSLINQVPASTKIQMVQQNDCLGKKLQLHILFPKQAKEAQNQDSLIVFCQLANLNYLFMGDLPIAQEQTLLSMYPNLSADIVKIGHHGSKTSTSEQFLKQIAPKIAIISVGKHNRYHHPNSEVITRLKKYNIAIRRTDQKGMIQYRYLPVINQWQEKLGA